MQGEGAQGACVKWLRLEGAKARCEEHAVGCYVQGPVVTSWSAGLLSQSRLTSRVGVLPPGLGGTFESPSALSPGFSAASGAKKSFLLPRVMPVLPVTPQLRVAKEAAAPLSPAGPGDQGASA